jgi:hypothetical protein
VARAHSTIRPTPALAAGFALALGLGCGATPRALEWGVRFRDPADRARAVRIEVTVRRDGCAGEPIFTDEIVVAVGQSMRMPARLPGGHYALAARARDAACTWFADGCTEVDLPYDGPSPVSVELVASAEMVACPASECDSGVCAGAGDAGPDDAGPDSGGFDAAPFDGGPRDGGAGDGGPPDGGPPDGGPPDARRDAPGDAGCTAELCNGRDDDCDTRVDETFDLTSDRNNCGTCGRRCGDSPATCTASACTCPMPWVWDSSPAYCVDLTRDASNCGMLGRQCRDDQVCAASACTCRPGLTVMGTACVDLQSDPSNCGTLGLACSGGTPVCDLGTCAASCGSPRTSCGGACVDRDRHPEHCGACFDTCSNDQVCVNGNCEDYRPALGCTTCSGCTSCVGMYDDCCAHAGTAACISDTDPGDCP